VETGRKPNLVDWLIGFVLLVVALAVIGVIFLGATDDCYMAKRDPVTRECRGRDGP